MDIDRKKQKANPGLTGVRRCASCLGKMVGYAVQRQVKLKTDVLHQRS